MPNNFPLGDVIALLGVISVILLAVLRDRFRTTFATRDELNGLGGKLHAFESLAIQIRERADAAHALAERAVDHGEHIEERMREMKGPMENLAAEMRQTREAIILLQAEIRHLRGDRER